MADSSGMKTAIMGITALAAIVLAIVVAVKTFSDPSVDAIDPPTEPISGSWVRKEGAETVEPPQGAPAEYMIAKDVTGFDASGAESGSVTLTLTSGTLQGKVMTSQPGHLLLQVQTAAGKTTQLTIAQMGEGGPAVVTDGITTVQFEKMP